MGAKKKFGRTAERVSASFQSFSRTFSPWTQSLAQGIFLPWNWDESNQRGQIHEEFTDYECTIRT